MDCKWEYLIAPRITIEILVRLGQDKWELVLKDEEGYIFKRPEQYRPQGTNYPGRGY